MKRDRQIGKGRAAFAPRLALVTLAAGIALAPAASAKASGDAPEGTWVSVPGFAVAREYQTVTLLASGKVLVAGGDEAGSAEVFDPATRKWTPTGSMLSPRSLHSATLLKSGQVLVVGGLTPAGPASQAEIYDPKTGKWQEAGSPGATFIQHTATLLSGGRVLVAGGRVGGHAPSLPGAFLFDPPTRTWVATGSMELGRSSHTATLLKDRRVLVTGGWPGGHDDSITDGQLYDPASGTWEIVPNLMTQGRAAHTATRLDDGRVLLVGGTKGLVAGGADAVLSSTEIFNPKTMRFSAARSLSHGRVAQGAALLASGRVLVVGFASTAGRVDVPKPVLAEVYDPKENKWQPTGSMPGAPGDITPIVLNESCGDLCGRVLVVGGALKDLGEAKSRFAVAYSPARQVSPTMFAAAGLAGLVLLVVAFKMIRKRGKKARF